MTETEKPLKGGQAGEKFIVRLPDGMRERIAVQAKKNNRSMNAEIVDSLEAQLDGRPIKSVEHYIRHLQLQMAGMQSELAVFCQEARAAAEFLIGLCEDLESMPGPRPRFLEGAKRMGNAVIQSADRYGNKNSSEVIAAMHSKMEEIISGKLHPHDFTERSVFEWAKDRAKDTQSRAPDGTLIYDAMVRMEEARKPKP